MPLYVKIIIGLVLGIIWSLFSSYAGFNQFTIYWIDPFGEIFIRLLKFIAVPLVLFSITGGVASFGDAKKLGRIGAKTLALYLGTTILAVLIGLFLANLFKPGQTISKEQMVRNRLSYELWASNSNVVLHDKIRLMDNPAHAAELEKIGRESSDEEGEVDERIHVAEENRSRSPLSYLVDVVPENIVLSISDNRLMLQVIFFAIFFGITLMLVPSERTKVVLDFINGVNDVFLKMVDIVMLAAPYFVFALMAGVVAKMAGNVSEVLEIFKSLGAYSLTVLLGLAIILFIEYPLLVRLGAKIGFSDFFRKMSPAQFLAFSTSSSAATLPVTIECVEKNLGVSKKVAGFVLPIGATVNMDGTCIYQTIAVVFLAQLHMIDLSFGQQITIIIMATLASIGSAAVPSGGIVMLMMVIVSIGLNPAWIAIILPMDRILDMCRTVVNVSGDAAVATMVAASEGELKKVP